MKRLTLALALLALPRPLLAAATAEAFVTMSPCRAVDTRGPAGPLGGPALTANQTRIFTLTGTCVAVAVSRPMSALEIASGPGPSPVPRSFAGFVGRTFQVATGDSRGTIDVVLDSYDEKPTKDGTHQFSLTFVAPGGENLAEGTYSVEQDKMGRFPLFVTPTRRDGQGRAFFRADFNLLLKK